MRLPAYSLPHSPDRRAVAAPCRRRPRGGYTLLEIILALSIAALLLAGLYYALYIQTNNTYSGRRLVERTALARAIVSRIQNDILSSLGPIDTQISANSKGSGSMSGSSGTGSTGTGSTGTGSTSGMSGSSNGSSGSNGSSSSNGSSGSSGSGSSSGSTQTSAQTFNLGLQGTSTQMSIYCSRVPREALAALNPNSAANSGGNGGTAPTQGVSDLRRITYWMASTSPGGLARQETLAVTSQTEIANQPPSVSDEASCVIQPEVVSIQFQYFDGTSWQDSWDGTQPGSDGVTPQGPPVAVAITVTITQPGSSGGQQGGQGGQGSQGGQTYQYYHVVGIPTANGAVTTANAANSQSTTGSSGSSSSGGN